MLVYTKIMKCICIGDTEVLSRLLPNEKPTETKTFKNPQLAKTYIETLSDNDWVLWCDGISLNPEQVAELERDKLKLDAGLLTGKVEKEPYLTVNDIYSPTEFSEVSGKGLQKVDIISPRFFIIKGQALKELDLAEEHFGLSLRKLGYQNYINMDIDINKENKNAKDNNVKGASSIGKIELG